MESGMARVVNRKAKFNYELGDKIEAGIILTGGEAKSARAGQVSMQEAFVKISNGEAFVYGMHIHPYKFANNKDYDPTRTRKLLLTGDELISLQSKIKQKGLTLVPTAIVTRGPRVKLEIALAKGKKLYEKREDIKKKDIQRDIEREIS